MHCTVIRYWGLGSLVIMMAVGCSNSDQQHDRSVVTTKRPILVIQPVEHKKSNKVIYGKASYYANMFQGRKTANGQIFDQGKLTAAHRTLPFGTKVKVTNTSNHKSVTVTVNDRGPFVRGRMIDLSSSAFRVIGNTRSGVLNVKMEIIK